MKKNIIFIIIFVSSIGSAYTFGDTRPSSDLNFKDGLVSYWDFDDISGTTLVDVHGTNHGVIIGSPGAVQGSIGNALLFGTDKWVDSENASGLPLAESVRTFSLWVKPTETSDEIRPIAGWGSSHLTWRIFTLAHNSNNRWIMMTNYDNNVFGDQIVPGEWYHLVATYDGKRNVKLYINGEHVHNFTTWVPLRTTGSAFRIGRYSYTDSGRFIGAVDEIGIWSRVLSDADVMFLYNEGNGLSYAEFEYPDVLFRSEPVPNEGIVEDIYTGLTWQDGVSPSTRRWAEAVDYCNNLEWAGFSDWRMPDYLELQTIMNFTHSWNSWPDIFDNRVPATCWKAELSQVFDTDYEFNVYLME